MGVPFSESARSARPESIGERSEPGARKAPRSTRRAPTNWRYIQNPHRPLAITYSDSARFVTPCAIMRSPSERVRCIHQL